MEARELLGLPALTMLPPWGTAIMRWGKPYENRNWIPPKSLHGRRVAIHQGQMSLLRDGSASNDRRNHHAAVATVELVRTGLVPRDQELWGVVKADAGRILGTVILSDVLRVDSGNGGLRLMSLWERPQQVEKPDEKVAGWINPESAYVFRFTDPQVLATPVPASGLQKFWTVSEARLAVRTA